MSKIAISADSRRQRLSNSAHTVHSKHNHSLDMKCYAAACLSQKQAHVATGASMPLQQRSIVGKSRPAVVEVVSFKFMKKLGVKKPGFLPDFGKAKRLAVIDNFFTHHDKSTLDSILADDAQIIEQGAKVRTYNKSEWVNLVTNHVVPAIPNFNWGHKTDGSKDDDGYSVVTVQATGKHSGKAFRIPGSELPKVQPTQEKFKLQEATLKVKIEDEKIQEIVMEPAKGAGFLAMYEAIGGKVSAA